MTSRPAGQRSLSGNNVLQRPQQQHRSLSHQYPSASSTPRKSNEAFVDLTLENTELTQSRYGSAQSRIGGSRLKLEVTKDSNDAGPFESPRPILDAPSNWKPPTTRSRGRPTLHSDVPSSMNPGAEQEREVAALPIRPIPMPMPTRPGQQAPATVANKPKSTPGTSAKKDARPKPYTLEVPSAAPHYTPNGHADFFPWTGNHPEDQFSESVIRQGFYDKTQMTQNETGSAKASIFPSLKHKSGLLTLSSLFTGVLAQRRAYGQITSNSTFKPPPRVTVTDTKREMWLKDLANPTISLRRLSRSIPHGIRGKVLLDQSLSKNIPVERAIWLAKCVGANELRSFRRKGVSGTFAMGGEAKWIRDFTVCVEQFLEGVIGLCGEKDFRNKINYAIRLSTTFHAEYLLDREHYMDWLVSSLEGSTQAKLPMWLLIVQIYWKDLLLYRKYARRISAALLGHFTEILAQEDVDILGPLLERLDILLRGLLITNPESFVSSKQWTKHRHVLLSKFSEDEKASTIVEAIDSRNQRLDVPSLGKPESARQQVIHRLDLLLSEVFINELPMRLWSLSDDKGMLMKTVLEWATSAYRPGPTKVFAGVRIIRSWGKLGAPITDAVLSFLDSSASQSGRSRAAVYHLVSELARSEHFSVPIYLQWLIACGAMNDNAEVKVDGAFATRLLVELPTHNLSEAMSELRVTLLSRAGFDVEEEEAATRACIIGIESSLPNMMTSLEVEDAIQPLGSENLSRAILASTRTTRSELGLFLRQKVAEHVTKQPSSSSRDWDMAKTGGISSITVSELSTIRRYLEMMDDYSMLADVLKLVTSSTDPEVLASVADSLDLHLETFGAIGAVKDLFEVLLARLRVHAEEHDYCPRVMLASLTSLASRIPDYNSIAQQLSQELARSDRKTAADACSPVSDHMAGVLQVEEADFTDEIERVLASGNSMDQATLERLFQRITTRLEESWGKSSEQQRSCALLLTRLRTFDSPQFDKLMALWVQQFKQMINRPSMTTILGPLISFGCLELKEVLVDTHAPGSSQSAQIISRNSLEELALATIPASVPELMTVEESYRLRVKQVHLHRDHAAELLQVIRRALNQPSADGIKSASHLLDDNDARETIQLLVVINSEAMSKSLVLPICQTGSPESRAAIDRLTDGLLLPDHGNSASGLIQADAVLSLASDFTLPFCQLKLASTFGLDASSSAENESDQASRLEVFEQAIAAAVASGSTTWASIIPLLNISVAKHLRAQAESQFLSLFPSLKSAASYDLLEDNAALAQARNLLLIVSMTAYSGPTSGTSLAAEIVASLNGMWQLLTSIQYSCLKDTVVNNWLPLLVSFTVTNNSAFESSKSGNEYRAKALLALSALLLELAAFDSDDQVISRLIERMFDLTILMVDTLPDDLRLQCIRGLHQNTWTKQLRYIFSFAPNPSDWLILSQKDKSGISGAQAGSATPTGAANESRTADKEKLVHFPLRRWEMLGVGSGLGCENDTSLSLTLFGARKS
ncbi:hypothetical protein BP6252_05459 [Coleophoma cylindrospora]|uniref:Mediator of RNA polymerase II transcription subunit 12 n=1 Tax=Coleophoma cylindrospora TaxID=1849047 RepID=A0A3D8RTV8_9HELO|nr:hypothetical protein BP6252_05459 [Coleophoma cylindrospora]